MGVVSRWMWVESMGVASGCGCKEVYRFPHITYPYSSFIYPTFCSFKKKFFCSYIYIYVYIDQRTLIIKIKKDIKTKTGT